MTFSLFINQELFFKGDLVIVSSLVIVGVFVLISLVVALVKLERKDNKLKAEFITIIAHKFRTPMTQIRWLIENLLSDEKDPYKSENLNEIRKSNDGLIKMTNALIEIADDDKSSSSSYGFEKTSICDLVKSTANQYKNYFHEKNIFFSVQCASDEINVKVDKQRMEFVIQTLLENAHNYSRSGGNVHLLVEKIGRKAMISVSDQGIGIDPHDLPKVFTKFFRADNAKRMDTEGFGIGLYFVKAIIRRHKGKIEVFSAGINRGTQFRIYLPIKK